MRLKLSWIGGSRGIVHDVVFRGNGSGRSSAFHYQVRLLGRFIGSGRFAAPPGALLPNVTSQASSRKKQRRERDEKDNQKPAHGTDFPKDTRERVRGRRTFLRCEKPFCSEPFHHCHPHLGCPRVPRFWGPGMMEPQTLAAPILESLYATFPPGSRRLASSHAR